MMFYHRILASVLFIEIHPSIGLTKNRESIRQSRGRAYKALTLNCKCKMQMENIYHAISKQIQNRINVKYKL